ncbi:hypothetical protein BDZ91DRAFT_1405 [Kalaharituber pfeilii]|nr:hypothetical protein BDZ91DRAFT_1405 [Kalaharituber pfeilii]
MSASAKHSTGCCLALGNVLFQLSTPHYLMPRHPQNISVRFPSLVSWLASFPWDMAKANQCPMSPTCHNTLLRTLCISYLHSSPSYGVATTKSWERLGTGWRRRTWMGDYSCRPMVVEEGKEGREED